MTNLREDTPACLALRAEVVHVPRVRAPVAQNFARPVFRIPLLLTFFAQTHLRAARMQAELLARSHRSFAIVAVRAVVLAA